MYCDGSSKVAKEMVKNYKVYIEKDDDDDDYEDSRELLIQHIMETDKNIDRLEKIKRTTHEKIDGLIQSLFLIILCKGLCMTFDVISATTKLRRAGSVLLQEKRECIILITIGW